MLQRIHLPLVSTQGVFRAAWGLGSDLFQRPLRNDKIGPGFTLGLKLVFVFLFSLNLQLGIVVCAFIPDSQGRDALFEGCASVTYFQGPTFWSPLPPNNAIRL